MVDSNPKVYRRRRHAIPKKQADDMLKDILSLPQIVCDAREMINDLIDKVVDIIYKRDIEFGQRLRRIGDIYLEARMAAECERLEKEYAEKGQKIKCSVDETALMRKVHERDDAQHERFIQSSNSFLKKMILILMILAFDIGCMCLTASIKASTGNNVPYIISSIVNGVVFAGIAITVVRHTGEIKDMTQTLPDSDDRTIDYFKYSFYRLNWEQALVSTEAVAVHMARAHTTQYTVNKAIVDLIMKLRDLERDGWITEEDAKNRYDEIMYLRSSFNNWCDEKLVKLVNTACTSSDSLYRFAGVHRMNGEDSEKNLLKYIHAKDAESDKPLVTVMDDDEVRFIDVHGENKDFKNREE